MENITIGQVSICLAFAVGLYGSVKYIVNEVAKATERAFKPIYDKIEKIEAKIDKVDKNATMNYLVRCMEDYDKGVKTDTASRRRFLEQYEHYTKDLKGNSYIKEEFERLKKEGKFV